jgi:hypothetical protein
MVALNVNCQNNNIISMNFPQRGDRGKKHCFFPPQEGRVAPIGRGLGKILWREKAGIKGGKMRRLRKIKEGINPCLLPLIKDIKSEITTENTEKLEAHLGSASGSLCIRGLCGFFNIKLNSLNKFFMLIIIRNKEIKLYAQFLFLNLL